LWLYELIIFFSLIIGSSGSCRPGQYVCDDGTCIRQGSGCNGRSECFAMRSLEAKRSDEINDVDWFMTSKTTVGRHD
jgi:hypothetical protein